MYEKKQVSQLNFILQLHNSDVWNQKNKTGIYRKQRNASNIFFFSWKWQFHLNKLPKNAISPVSKKVKQYLSRLEPTVRLLTHVLCKPTHFFFHSFIATMSYSLQTSFNGLMKDWADKYHVWGTPTRWPSRSNSR